MIKKYCDICGEPALNDKPISEGSPAFHAIKSSLNGERFEFQVKGIIWKKKKGGCWELFDSCKECLAKIILNLEEAK